MIIIICKLMKKLWLKMRIPMEIFVIFVVIVNPPNKHWGRLLIDIDVVVDHGHVGVGVAV